jgi:hypothetical protein
MLEYVRLCDLQVWDLNPKEHDLPYLKSLIRKYGFNQPPAFRDGVLYVGNGRTTALQQMFAANEPMPHGINLDEDGMWLVPTTTLDHLTDEEAKAYAVQDNVANARGKLDKKMMQKLIQQGQVKAGETGLSTKKLRTIMQKQKKQVDAVSTVRDVPEAVLPREFKYGITMLTLSMQADLIDLPFIKWGTLRRSDKHEGTVHFYTEDYKFSALLKNPLKVVDTKCTTAVEPNFSTYEQQPLYDALYYIGQKRYMARLWQENGIKILVDLNVNPMFGEENLLGVPKGWGAYCIRGKANQIEFIEFHYDLAYQKAEKAPHLFAVYGGGNTIKKYCEEREWVWIPEYQAEIERKIASGQ